MGKLKQFTLVEMLVVVAIIGILASLLMPALHGALAMSRAAGCMNNQKQIGVGINTYTMDFAGRLPYYYYQDTWTNMAPDLMFMPQYGCPGVEYVKNRSRSEMIRCPSDDIEPGTSGWQMNSRRTYSMNSNNKGAAKVQVCKQTGNLNDGTPLARIASPSGVIMMLERPANNNYAGNITCSISASADNQSITLNKPGGTLHRGNYNYLFVDGHVEVHSPLNTVGTGTFTNSLGMWTSDLGD